MRDNDGVELLESAGDIPGPNSLQLGLDLNGSRVIDYLHPGFGKPSTGMPIATLSPGQQQNVSFSGTYHGLFVPGTVYRPMYSLVWLFTPVIGGE